MEILSSGYSEVRRDGTWKVVSAIPGKICNIVAKDKNLVIHRLKQNKDK
jgi:hypothetical protein